MLIIENNFSNDDDNDNNNEDNENRIKNENENGNDENERIKTIMIQYMATTFTKKMMTL